MKIYQFPYRDSQSFKELIVNEIVDHTFSQIESHRFDEQVFSNVIEGVESSFSHVSFSLKNCNYQMKDLLSQFISEFPSFQQFESPVCLEEILDMYLRDDLSDEQDIILEILLDLLGLLKVEPCMRESFLQLAFEDQKALGRIYNLYANYLNGNSQLN